MQDGDTCSLTPSAQSIVGQWWMSDITKSSSAPFLKGKWVSAMLLCMALPAHPLLTVQPGPSDYWDVGRSTVGWGQGSGGLVYSLPLPGHLMIKAPRDSGAQLLQPQAY